MPENIVEFDFGPAGRERRRLIPWRLAKARRAERLTQTDLAAKVGLTRQAISAFEQGSKHPDGATLFALSRELKQPVSYFTGVSPEPFGPFSARTFRAFGAITKRRNDQCEVLSEWLASVTSYYSGMVNFPKPNVPATLGPTDGDGFSDEEIENAAAEVRRSWGLGDGPIGNLIKLVESRGIFVAHLPIADDTVNAFSFWSGAVPFIIMGTDETSAVRRRFDIAHELGHLVLHQGVSDAELEDKFVLSRIEAEANRFAGAFLLPAKTYPNEVFTTRLEAFQELKSRWKVAIAAQIYRCSDLGLFSERQTLNLRKQLSARKWRKHEPLDDILPLETPSLVSKGAELILKSNRKTTHEIVAEINISPEIVEVLSGVPAGTFRSESGAAPVVSLK